MREWWASNKQIAKSTSNKQKVASNEEKVRRNEQGVKTLRLIKNKRLNGVLYLEPYFVHRGGHFNPDGLFLNKGWTLT